VYIVELQPNQYIKPTTYGRVLAVKCLSTESDSFDYADDDLYYSSSTVPSALPHPSFSLPTTEPGHY